jgi:hypothetical protein
MRFRHWEWTDGFAHVGTGMRRLHLPPRGQRLLTTPPLIRPHLSRGQRLLTTPPKPEPHLSRGQRLLTTPPKHEPEHIRWHSARQHFINRNCDPLQSAEVLRQLAAGLHGNEDEIKRLAGRLNRRTRSELASFVAERRFAQANADNGSNGFSPAKLSLRGLTLLGFARAIPFIGFGIMDNAVMILAGERIDSTIGMTFHLSTLAAAGLGNAISDVIGIGAGNMVEQMAEKLGVPEHGLTHEQQHSREGNLAATIGSAVGCFVGCLIGLFPLLFLDHSNTIEDRKTFARLERAVADARRRGESTDAVDKRLKDFEDANREAGR